MQWAGCCERLYRLVQHSKHPEGNTISVACFDVVNSQITVRQIFDLEESFPLAANFKKIPVTDNGQKPSAEATDEAAAERADP